MEEHTIGTFEEELRKREEMGFESVLFLQVMKINNSETSEEYVENISRLEDELSCFYDDDDEKKVTELLETTKKNITSSRETGHWSQINENSMWKEHAKSKFRTILMPLMRREGWLGEPKRSLMT